MAYDGKPSARGPVENGYRNSIADERVNYYWDNVYSPTTALGFAVHLTEGRRSRFAAKVGAILARNKQTIEEIIGEQIRLANASVLDAVQRVNVPDFVAGSVVGLVVAAVKAVATAVADALAKAFSDVQLTTWLVYHTVVMDDRNVPVSMFTLSLPGTATPRLQYLRHAVSGQPELSDDYSSDPGNRRQARFMIGESTTSQSDFDLRLWDLTAESGQPLAWREPRETNSGLRLLLPHYAEDRKASYVSAIRAEIHLEQPVPKPKGPFSF